MQIGDVLYTYDINRRFYYENKEMDIRKCWRPHSIIGETRTSWIVEGDGKIDKKTLEIRGLRNSNGMDTCAYTESEMKERLWLQLNYRRIVNAVEGSKDVTKLSQIAVILGVECEE